MLNKASYFTQILKLSQIIYIFATKYNIMASIEENILTAIKAKGRGSIFFPSDFTSYGEVKAVGKSLERLTAKGDIIRLLRTWRIDALYRTDCRDDSP